MWQSLIAPVSNLLDKVIPDADERARLAFEIDTLAENHAQALALAQLEVNKQEAAHKSLFVAGWRPGCGWVCVLALAYSTIAQPIISIWVEAPAIESGLLYPVLMGMLGLGTMRSYEKKNGVAREK